MRLMGSGPKKELNTPGVELTVSSETCASLLRASRNPPFELRTARMTATIPKSIIMPCMKSLIAVAIYPPAITYIPVRTAIRMMQYT